MRMMALAILALVGGTVSGPAQATVTAPVTVAAAGSCLTLHSVIATRTATRVVAPGSPQLAALRFSFSLVTGARLNSGVIAFEKTAAIASRVGSVFLRFQLRHFASEGVHVTTSMIKDTYLVINNSVVFWAVEPGTRPIGEARATRTLTSCLT